MCACEEELVTCYILFGLSWRVKRLKTIDVYCRVLLCISAVVVATAAALS